jgi:ParB family chromosome partitioning protein
MARKNIFGTDPSASAGHDEAGEDARPLAHFEKPLRRSGPVGAISQSLGGINEKAQRAADLEQQLAKGLTVVELEPSLIDSSFVPDRLGVDAADQENLVAQIREHGQQVPILVRPHPDQNNRYQVAYGHRRLAAVKELGIAVRAVVRELTDEQLVVSQGQENNARTDLTFIERSFFAYRLERRGFSRDIIMSSLGVDKAAVSRMIALIERLPEAVIAAIGRAPGFGRSRWADMADFLEDEANRADALAVVATGAFLARTSDERFDYLFNSFQNAATKPRVSTWAAGGRRNAVRITETGTRLNLIFDKAVAADFGAYVERRLDDLYAAYVSDKQTGD